MSEAEVMAQRFHEAYERLAPSFGYETREASAKPWAQVPEQNRALMVAVCTEILTSSPLVWAGGDSLGIHIEFETDVHRAEVEALRAQIAALTAERDRAQRLAGEARALLGSWYHDPDCSVGRRELQHFEGEKVCAHFKERWRHQCAEALLALGGAEPDGEAVGPSES